MFTKQEIKERLVLLQARGTPIRAGYNLACFIADAALIDRRDKSGTDYAHHTTAVSTYNTDSEIKMIIGKLHDVVEDSDWTLDDLREVGFSERVIHGVDGMTCRKDEKYFDFIARCGLTPDSVDVKLKDLRHNMSQSRNDFLMEAGDRERVNKYILSYNYLVDIKRERIRPGTSFDTWMKAQKPELQDFGLLIKYSTRTCAGPSPVPSPTPSS